MTTGPLAADERALGPDLARGAMLLFIALANAHVFLLGDSYLAGYPLDGSTLDRAVGGVLATFVDGRAYPLFGLLFGYGVARVAERHAALGPRRVRRLLWRRAAVLVVLGLLHALLLFAGDILAAYGVLLLVGAWAVRLPDGWLLGLAPVLLLVLAVPDESLGALLRDPPEPALLSPDLATQAAERAVLSLLVMLAGPFGFGTSFLLGLWAGRRRVLEQPDEHRRLLRTVAAVGVPVAVLGALPVSLAVAGVVPVPSDATLGYLAPLRETTGVVGGAGYAALLVLVAARVRQGPLVRALAATGRRSMTCYLAQSLVWAVAFAPYLLGLADDLGVAATALLSLLTWAATVVLAVLLERAGRPGPFEVLVRRVTYAGVARPT